MLDVEKLRRDFPIFSNKGRAAKRGKGEKKKPPIYLDSAATSQRPGSVIDACASFYSEHNSNVHRGLYPLAEEATFSFEGVRKKTASFINAKDEREVIFTKNTTESANAIMRGWGEKFISKGDRIVTTIMEHHSNFVPWQELARRRGATLDVVGIDDEGLLDMADLERKAKGSKLVAFTAASNVIGTRTDVQEICSIARDAGAVSVVDGAQSVPSSKTDVRRLGCDFLMFSGHKMLAPFGVGVLYGREDILEGMDPFMYGSEMIRSVSVEKSEWSEPPYRFEPGTPDVTAVIGLGVAIDYLLGIGLDAIKAHEESLVSRMLDELERIDGLTVLGPKDAKKRGPLVAFTLDPVHPHDVAAMLAEDSICVRSGHHCAMPLHERLGIPASTRASVYLYNKKDEIDALAVSLKKAKKAFS
jgi:cysteine desulfurase/selenocysteine lyase